MRRCSKCGEVKLVASFSKDRHKQSGLTSACKACMRASAALSHRRNYARVKGRKNDQRRARYAANPDSQRAAARRDYQQNTEARRATVRLYRRDNPEKVKLAVDAAKRKKPELYKAIGSAKASRRRANLWVLLGSHTAEDILRIYEEQGGRCYYCGEDLEGRYNVDHKIPLSRPELSPTNDPDNLCCACASCNGHKHDMTAQEYIAHRLARGLPIVRCAMEARG